MARINTYDFMNLIAVFDHSLRLLIRDMNEERYDRARLRALDMCRAIDKLKGHTDARMDNR